MKNFLLMQLAVVTLLALGGSGSTWAQQTPDTIFYNGKVVTVDNHEVNSEVGTIAQALAVKGNTIVAVGSNVQIRKLAGATTKSMDLKGRTVLPGFAATHDHPQDWDPLNPYIVRKLITDDMHIERFMWEDSPDQKIQQFPRVLDEAAHKAKPGQWIRISMLYGKEMRGIAGGSVDPSRDKIVGTFGRQINKQILDMIAPNNPVIVRAGFVGTMINQRGIDDVAKWYQQWGQESQLSYNPKTQVPGSTSYRQIEQDVLYPQKELREIYR